MRVELALRDEDIIHGYLKAGDRDLLDELVERHVAKVRSLVYSMVLDDATADDLTQEVFLRVFHSLASFNGHARFSTWLYRIGMNTARTYLERQGRSPVIFRSDMAETAADSSPAPAGGELEREVETALSSLSPKLRAAIVLVCLQGRTAAEAAEIEGCSVATMYWRVHAARKKLKQRLAGFLE